MNNRGGNTNTQMRSFRGQAPLTLFITVYTGEEGGSVYMDRLE